MSSFNKAKQKATRDLQDSGFVHHLGSPVDEHILHPFSCTLLDVTQDYVQNCVTIIPARSGSLDSSPRNL